MGGTDGLREELHISNAPLNSAGAGGREAPGRYVEARAGEPLASAGACYTQQNNKRIIQQYIFQIIKLTFYTHNYFYDIRIVYSSFKLKKSILTFIFR